MSAIILGLLAETFVHPGTGQTTGAIDLPVARERVTHYPYIPGASLKGAIKEVAERVYPPTKDEHGRAQLHPWVRQRFGEQDNAGGVQFSDARLLLLPIRSLRDTYKWVTCPLLLERFERDCKRAGGAAGYDVTQINPPPKKYLNGAGAGAPAGPAPLYLEEWTFPRHGAVPPTVIEAIKSLLPANYSATRARLSRQLVVLADEDFERFARSGLHIAARNVLTEQKTSKNLWYEESLPPDSLMYTLLSNRSEKGASADEVAQLFEGDHKPYLQVGGNETVGQGWFVVARRSA